MNTAAHLDPYGSGIITVKVDPYTTEARTTTRSVTAVIHRWELDAGCWIAHGPIIKADGTESDRWYNLTAKVPDEVRAAAHKLTN